MSDDTPQVWGTYEEAADHLRQQHRDADGQPVMAQQVVPLGLASDRASELALSISLRVIPRGAGARPQIRVEHHILGRRAVGGGVVVESEGLSGIELAPGTQVAPAAAWGEVTDALGVLVETEPQLVAAHALSRLYIASWVRGECVDIQAALGSLMWDDPETGDHIPNPLYFPWEGE